LDDAPACVSCPTRQLARHLQKDWRGWFLHGGEDYELLFAAAAAFDPSNLITSTGIPITRIGRFFPVIQWCGRLPEQQGDCSLKQGGWTIARKSLAIKDSPV